MRSPNRFRPSPAMVVASLALLVALGGTGIAAVTATLPRNSVGTPQLKNNAVTSAKVRNNAINSNKVQNRSLLAADFAPGQIPAGPEGPAGPPGPSGPSGPAGVAPPGYIASIVSQSSTSSSSTSSTSFIELPGSSQTITVPVGQTARIVALFSAESACYGGSAGQYCGVRVTVNGNELAPGSGSDFAFHSVENGGSQSWESHSIVRISDTLPAGNHTVRAEYRTTNAATTLRLDDWMLAVMLQRQS